MSEPLVIVFPIYQGVTQLDFTGPLQFLRRMPGAEIIVASVDGADVESEGLHFTQLRPLPEIARCDVLCVPGGSGCTRHYRMKHSCGKSVGWAPMLAT